jgi:hypothetical protein
MQPKTLTDICVKYVVSKYTFFKKDLPKLPTELCNKIEDEKINQNFNCINGKYYPKQIDIDIINSYDWSTYKN